MATMGRYCKAYLVDVLKRFPGWPDQLPENARKDQGEQADSKSDPDPPDDEYLFVQESLIVTRGVLLGEDMVFSAVTPEWEKFCRLDLQFAIPPELLDDAESSSAT